MAIYLMAGFFLPASAGDTITVQTFTFGSPQEGTFLFPPDTVRFEKILMYYTLKCNPAQNPACGEWDYLTYTYLFDHTGQYDSILQSHPNFTVGGLTPDSLSLAFQPAWSFHPYFEYFITYTDTLSQHQGQVGNGTQLTAIPFGTNIHQARSFLLWKASELQAAGLSAGDITNLKVFFTQLGIPMNHLTIRMAHTTVGTLDSLSWPSPPGLQEVYHRKTDFQDTGWVTFNLTTPFNWDGTSNILMEICFDNPSTGLSYKAKGETTSGFTSVLTAFGRDYALKFRDADHVDVPVQVFNDIDSAITIEFWQYGDPDIQPQSDIIFEGIDSAGNRVLNAHLPWGNGRVYWDAGNNGNSYDRIDKAANPADYEGRWNHWAFVKDVATGSMKIYLNGQLWHSGTGKNRLMNGIVKFTIGSGAHLNYFYDGMINEFRIWNIALPDSLIRDGMYRKINSSHPFWDNLKAYYRFDDAVSNCAADYSDYSNLATMYGAPEWVRIPACDLLFKSYSGQTRPNMIFEQNTYNAFVDSTLMVDSTQQNQLMVVLFDDTTQPTVPTDTLWAWPAWYHYTYDSAGQAIDSSLAGLDTTIYHVEHYYYDPPFEIVNRYELGRFITPYGIGLSLGNEGWTWIYDVTDFRPLLADSVHLKAGNWQELLDMKFVMIKGTPPRDVKDIRNVWNGSHMYNAAIENEFLYPKKFFIPPDVAQARLRINITGHGFGGNLNCSEFCPRTNTVRVNGQFKALQNLWRNDCDLNPLFPQGGTWIYDRAGWCPGSEVRPFYYDLSSNIIPGDSVEVDFDMQPGYVWNGQGSTPHYRIESQLVTYGPPNFTLDAAVSEIIAPTDWEYYRRFNPICDNAIVKIRNTGSSPLTSLDISYGPQQGNKATYHWTGNLGFLEDETVYLPPSDWGSWTGPDIFEVTVSNPNGGNDEYADNNTMRSHFLRTPLYDNDLVLWLRTNNAGYETSYMLKDENGNVLYSRSNCSSNTVYKDTFHLANGCYTLTINDSGEDGLYFFANNDGSGWARLRKMNGVIVKNFKADFGSKISQQFTTGFPMGTEEPAPESFVEVYPNPASGLFNVDVNLAETEDLDLTVYDLTGRALYHTSRPGFRQGIIEVDLKGFPAGMYLCIMHAGEFVYTGRLLVQ